MLEVNRLFQWLLPGLIANVAFFRAQLLEDWAGLIPGSPAPCLAGLTNPLVRRTFPPMVVT